MTRYQLFRVARICGYAFWWFFIAATMVAGGISWFGDSDRGDAGWIVHGSRMGEPRRYTDYVPSDGFDITSGLTFVAFCLLVLAAVAEAVAVRRVAAGIITVLVPFVTAALIWAAMPLGHWSFFLESVPAVLVILVAVAIREVWTRRLAPSATAKIEPR
ncbi:hypothetical protein [Nocardia sp. CDC160]|uniref:hypothetical protein n=1 Tax=Nocardia sp. CDC160 TaxID=3112166 RepID=UPI002DB5CAC3|nr:hypothetical protein [Nocardia sp. CDC160]MEC3918636.1 hypothetical protein [Nocardia sp. CDC160]